MNCSWDETKSYVHISCSSTTARAVQWKRSESRIIILNMLYVHCRLRICWIICSGHHRYLSDTWSQCISYISPEMTTTSKKQTTTLWSVVHWSNWMNCSGSPFRNRTGSSVRCDINWRQSIQNPGRYLNPIANVLVWIEHSQPNSLPVNLRMHERKIIVFQTIFIEYLCVSIFLQFSAA